MDKPKIFVRYRGGTCGHFVSLVLLSLIDDISIRENWRGHLNIDDINTGHNFYNQWTEEFDYHTCANLSNLPASIAWMQRNFQFYNLHRCLYVIHTHAINPTPLLLAFNNTKLVNISFREEDLDQLYYNWIIKSCQLYGQWSIVQKNLANIQTIHGRLGNLSADDINQNTDTKLCTYILKYGAENKIKQFIEFDSNKLSNVFNLAFVDIFTGKFENQLDELIGFLNIQVTPRRKEKTLALIKAYADLQIPVPWKLTLEEYD